MAIINANTFQRGTTYYHKKIWALNPATNSALPLQNGCNCLNSTYGDPVLLHFKDVKNGGSMFKTCHRMTWNAVMVALW